jgi:hypothetical protein
LLFEFRRTYSRFIELDQLETNLSLTF